MPDAILVSDRVAERYRRELARAAPGRPLAVLGPDGVSADPAEVEIAFFSGDLFPERSRALAKVLHQAPALGWFHSFAAGVDHPWFQGFLARGVRVTTSSGASAIPIAHTVMLYLLHMSRDMAGWARDQASRVWHERNVEDLQGRRVVVVGLGPIGLEVARLALAFRMEVVGLRRTPRGDEPCKTTTLDALDALLPELDYLVLALPLTPQTEKLLGAERIARLPPHARVVNVGRGGLIDEPALVEALRSGALGGAALDVFEVEPLPESSPLWSLPNVIITPHSAGTNPGNQERAAAIFLENLARYLRGEALRNEVVAES